MSAPVRLTRRGRIVATSTALLAGLALGLTAEAWNPCARPDTACVIEATP